MLFIKSQRLQKDQLLSDLAGLQKYLHPLQEQNRFHKIKTAVSLGLEGLFYTFFTLCHMQPSGGFRPHSHI